jgi:hypothetical protein
MLVATAKINIEEQGLVKGTKQSNQADKSGRLASLPDLFWVCCFALCLPLMLALPSGFYTNTP